MKRNPFNQFLRNQAGDGGDGGGGGTPPPGSNTPAPQNTPVATPTPSLLTNPGEHAWYKDLPEDLRTAPYLQQAKDLPTFVKMAIDTKAMVGANTVKLPSEKATPEERAAFFDKLGRPPNIEGYKNTVQIKEETLAKPEAVKQMAAVFHEAGLTAEQGSKILDSYFTMVNGEYDSLMGAYQASQAEAINGLKAEWGVNYEANVKTAQLAVRELGDPTLMEHLTAKGLADDPVIIKLLYNAGTKLLDDSAKGDGGGQFKGSPEAAVAEINRLKGDSDFMAAWDNASHAAHKEAVARWEQLHREAYPGKQRE